MKCIVTALFVFAFSLTGNTQSQIVKSLELKRLSLENKYGYVGNFDTLTGIASVYNDGRQGFIDTSGKLMLPIAFGRNYFSDGLGVYYDVEQKAFMLIDKAGKLVKEFKNINSLQGFKNGLSVFSASTNEGEKYGIINLEGDIIIPSKYPYIEKISEKYFFVNSNKQGAGIINLSGDTVIPLQYRIDYIDTTDLHFIGYKVGVGYAIFDSSGKVKKFWGKEIYPQKSYIEGNHYFQRDSVIIIQDRWSSTYAKTALVNLNLDTIVPMGKYHLSVINEGLISFYDSVIIKKLDERVTTQQVTKCGFLNTKGDIIIPAKFDFAHYFTEGLCGVKQDNKWGYINKKGVVVIPLKFDYVLPFHHGYAKVQIKDNFFIIDNEGTIVLKSKSY